MINQLRHVYHCLLPKSSSCRRHSPPLGTPGKNFLIPHHRWPAPLLRGRYNCHPKLDKSASTTDTHHPPIPHPKFHLTFPQKRVLFATLVTLIISAASFTLIKASPKGEVLKLLSFFQRPPAASTMNHELTNQLTSQVLASQTALEDLRFTVNIPALFNKDITAPNVIYSLTAGDNITITPGQRPTISATDQTTDLKISAMSKLDQILSPQALKPILWNWPPETISPSLPPIKSHHRGQ